MKKREGSDDHTNVPLHPTLPTLLSYHTSPYLSPQVACSIVGVCGDLQKHAGNH